MKLKTLGRDGISINHEIVDLRNVEQLCDSEQTAALGYCLLYAQKHLMDGKRTLSQIVDALGGPDGPPGPDGFVPGAIQC